MLLDATTFKTELTPEAALSIVQSEVRRKRWPKYEVEEIRLVYVPYYSFSFDVTPSGAEPVSGNAAINARTGEINETVPYVLDKPWKKTKETEEGAEVEETTIPKNEVRDAAAAKIAAQTGIKKDLATITAVSKVYLPVYRIWVGVAGDVFKIEVDALTGIPGGAEAIPARPKTWSESANETVQKMKTPAGWAELAGKTGSAIAGAAAGAKGGGHGEGGGGQQKVWLLLGGIIVVLIAAFLLSRQSGASCTGEIEDFGEECRLDGVCTLSNPGDDLASVQTRIVILEEGRERYDLGDIIGAQLERKTANFERPFALNWSSDGKDCRRAFSWRAERLS